ncbi:chromodomain-helicase-DNA-binding protein 1-like [Gadus macrocephalus]|uniref:chromodomain-helicase-DNA-binding protein 1-like n=1 Tax=Gadus macrocephalus TaxID=80720 RepID=UPI0028CB547C|nr:chromodomain-helicase-DNA-binding protein 1-like [Gadus macrocephalus]
MSSFALKTRNSVPAKRKTIVAQSDLQKWGLHGIQLRSYQLDGVQWLTQCLQNQDGCILGDEMGLGKTCQTISLLVYMKGCLGVNGPFLVLSPLSVLENWRTELESFAPSLSVLCYKGDKEKRAELKKETEHTPFNVLLTTYEICLKDFSFLKSWKWKALVVDEAHRLKNQDSLLHKTLSEFSMGFRVLLTGTPIQNNLLEVYSLISFIQPSLFPADQAKDFVQYYADLQNRPALAAELQSMLEPFLLRRVKAEVAADLPGKMELLVYHGMSALQKKYYKAILTKDLDAFGNEQGNKTRLMNILMQLRKCVDHPYLFDGVEPEPFIMGEHLIEASGKMCLLDSLLSFLHKGGHRVLLFSQMTRMLDILQDYMEYRGYSYERLDGSVRGEERNLAIKNFSSKDVFVFMLSTKAGGVGLNLTAADTVVFMDSDFNPQNDLQAAARCHRIGQTRPVKVIRLLGRDSVEEMVYSRATSKLDLTKAVIEEGRFSLLDQASAGGLQLSEILKFGVDKLLASEESSIQDVDLGKIVGHTKNGQWVAEQDPASPSRGEEEDEGENDSEDDVQNGKKKPDHMYYFEGRDYSKEPSTEDLKSFQRLQEEQLAELTDDSGEGPSLRHKAGVLLTGPLGVSTRKRKPLSAADLELRRQKNQESAAKRAKLQQDRKRKLEEQKQKKKMDWWQSSGYRSLCLHSEDSCEDEEEEGDDVSLASEGSTESDPTAIHYVLGDVTHPQTGPEDAIIVHCVDDSGRWGRGGLFTALEMRSDEPSKQYELAGSMKDLDLGNVLLFPIDDKQSRLDGQDQLALIVAQQRDRSNNLSGIHLSALEGGLKKIYSAARRSKASVHLPRIGHSTRGFNWYGTERLIRKYLSSKGVPTFIYYHKRTPKKTAAAPALPPQPSASTSAPPPPAEPAPVSPGGSDTGASGAGTRRSAVLPDFMKGAFVFFYNLPATEKKRLARHLVTYDGDEEDVMSPTVTHVVAKATNAFHSKALQDMLLQYPQAVATKTAWLDTCYSRQTRVDATPFLHAFR